MLRSEVFKDREWKDWCRDCGSARLTGGEQQGEKEGLEGDVREEGDVSRRPLCKNTQSWR